MNSRTGILIIICVLGGVVIFSSGVYTGLYINPQNQTSQPNFLHISGNITTENYLVGRNLVLNGVLLTPEQLASALIWRDGSTYYSKDTGSGAVIHDSRLSTILNKYMKKAGQMYIVFKPNTTYALTERVVLGPGVMLDFYGATLDISQIDDTAFVFNNDDSNWAHYQLTGIRDVYVYGDLEKRNTRLVYLNQIDSGVLFENIHLKYVNNGFKIRGACYSGEIRNCDSYANFGDFIMLEGFSLDDVVYASNSFKISECQVTASTGSAGYGVKILGDGGDYNPEGVFIESCWIENTQYGILVNGKACKILGNIIYSNLRGIWLDDYSSLTTISDNEITATSLRSAGIYNQARYQSATISSNMFNFIKGVAMNMTVETYVTISGNTCSFEDDAAVFLLGIPKFSTITGNRLMSDSNGIGIKITSTAAMSNTLIGNLFSSLSKALSSAVDVDSWLIEGNTFDSCSTAVEMKYLKYSLFTGNIMHECKNVFNPVLYYTNNKISNNVGYVTEKSGLASVSVKSSTVTVYHGLSLNPDEGDITVMPTTSLTNCTYYYVDGITPTTFKIHLATSAGDRGPNSTVTFAWRAEKTP